MRWTCAAQAIDETMRNDTAALRTFLKTFGRRPRFDRGARKKQSHTYGHAVNFALACTMKIKSSHYKSNTSP